MPFSKFVKVIQRIMFSFDWGVYRVPADTWR